MENKNEENENKIIPGDFNCTMNKMERDGRNETLNKCHFNYAKSKLIVDNGLEDPWRRKNPDSSEVHPLQYIFWHKIYDRQGLY